MEKTAVRICALWREEPILEQFCWQDLGPYRGSTLKQFVPKGWHPMKRAHTRAVHEKLQPRRRTYIGEINRELSPMGEM